MNAGVPQGAILAIESSGDIGSVALATGGKIVAQSRLKETRGHAAALIPAIGALLERHRTPVARLAGIVVGAGPGSFTGVRIAAAAAKALAATLRLPLFPVSSLRAAALAGPAGQGRPAADSIPSRDRYVLFDARRGRVYAACYRIVAGSVTEVVAPCAATVVDVLSGRPRQSTIFAGSGAIAHTRLLHAAGYAVAPLPQGVPDAHAVIRACTWNEADPATWEPDYLREWRPG